MRYRTAAAVALMGLILSACQTVQLAESEKSVDGMDYESVRERHVILEENICVNPQSAFENEWLCEQMAWAIDEIENTKRLAEETGEFVAFAVMDYFLFDFNNDGTDEYIVSIYGTGWGDQPEIPL